MTTRKVIWIIAIIISLGMGFSQATEETKRDFVCVAIVPFVNISGIEERDAWGHVISELMVTNRLSSVKGIVTYKPSDLMNHLKQFNNTIKDCTTKEVALALGKHCYADYVVYGTLDSAKDKIYVSINLLDIAQNQDRTLYLDQINEDGLLELDIILAKKIVATLNNKVVKISNNKILTQKKIFNYYSKGIAAWNKAECQYSGNKSILFEESLKWFERSLEADPQNANSMMYLARCLLELYRLNNTEEFAKKALCYAENAAQLSPTESEAYLVLGESFRAIGNYDEALKAYDKSISLCPFSSSPYCNIGIIQRERGDLSAAIKIYKKAIKMNPGDAYIHSNLGNALVVSGKSKEAILEYQRALECDASFVDAYYGLGCILYETGEFASSQRMYKKAIEFWPEDAFAHNNIANALVREGNIEESINIYKKALRLNPNFAIAHFNLGVALENLNRVEEAISSYKNSVTIDSKKPKVYCALGDALKRKFDIDEALKAYQEAIKIDPNYAMAYNKIGIVCMKLNDNIQAIVMLKKAIENDPNLGEAYNNLIAAYYFEQDYSSAKMVIEKANRLGLKNSINPKLINQIKKQ